MKTLKHHSRARPLCASKWRSFLHALLFGLLCLAGCLPAQAKWLTLVSLTFDDGLNQSQVGSILKNHGMKATFYINSNMIDAGSPYLSKVELDALYADGHEIGGHTINHVDLATLSDNDQKTAICNDMKNLVNWGYAVYSFAYPYGSTGANSPAIVQAGCPGVGTYESARTVGNLTSGAECYNCSWAESIPPANRYYISTNNSIDETATLDTLKSYVLQAEANGGGWVPLVFHRVCANNTCGSLSITPELLDQFLSWLETRTSQATYVRTVHQVMTGDYPAPPPPPSLGINLITNPSLEMDADKNNQADCWLRSNYGSNTGAWTHINNSTKSHTGSFSEQITVTQYNSGDRQLVPTQDAGQAGGGCAPTVSDQSLYQLSVWYKATVPVASDLFYLDANSNWQYWRDGPQLPASANWSQMIYYPGMLPAGAKALSFGVYLASNGTLLTDDYALSEILDTPPVDDSTPPVITNVLPVDGSVATGVVNLSATVTDNVGISQVDFAINGTVVASRTASPYSVSWNSALVPNGTVNYTVTAVDLSANTRVSDTYTLTAQNDLVPPTVSFIQPPTPTNGAIVSGTVSLQANASDDVGVSRVDFLVNGAVVGSVASAPYALDWNTLLSAEGSAVVTAKAYDSAGNSATTTSVQVTVNNFVGNLLNNPSLEIDANNDAMPDCWQSGGYGSNTFQWSRLSGSALAHSGNFAESVTVSNWTSGDRKLVTTQNAGTCSPTVTPGKRYTLSSWFKSTATTGIVVFYRAANGVWTYWQSGAILPATNKWTQASYTTPAVPAGATALSFGLYLNSRGTLVTDDYAMTKLP